VKGAASRLHEKLAPASVEVKVKLAFALLLLASGPEVISVSGNVINANVAVMFFGAFITIVCGFIVPEMSPLNPVNRNPGAGVAVMGTESFGLKKPPVVIEPPDDGLAEVVSRYWVMKFAVNVVFELGAARLREIAPLSLQPLKMYCAPLVPCGEVVAMV